MASRWQTIDRQTLKLLKNLDGDNLQPELWDAPEKAAPTVAGLRAAFNEGVTRPISWRKAQLRALIALCEENAEVIAAAHKRDLGNRTFFTDLTNITPVVVEAKDALRDIDSWVKPDAKGIPLLIQPGTAEVRKEPYGVVCVIAPWNYPWRLALLPLVGAIAAGNACLIKPSEV